MGGQKNGGAVAVQLIFLSPIFLSSVARRNGAPLLPAGCDDFPITNARLVLVQA